LRAWAGILIVVVGFGVVACGSHSAVPAPRAPQSTLGDLKPPTLEVTHRAQGTSPGYLFVAEKKSKSPGGPMIVANNGGLVWYHQLASPLQATDFRVQTYQGKPVLTWWQGTINKAGVGEGEDVIYDDAYRQIATVHAGDGLKADLHEFQLTPRGTAFITAYSELPADLSSVGGPKHSWLLDSVVQEIDVASGRVIFTWHSVGHVPLSDSRVANAEPARHASKKRPLDYFHVNSVSDGPNGTILVSARNMSVIYDIARDGHIVWQFGGKHSDFGSGSAVKLNYQHNARLHGSVLTVFDNGAVPPAEPFTRPMEIQLDFQKRTAKVVTTFLRPKRLLSPYEGNLQLLPAGGAVVGWGGIPTVSEFGDDGKVRFELKLPYGDTYRGYRYPWSGHPAGVPRVGVFAGTVLASWNGATGIVRWEVLGGRDADHLSVIDSRSWQGLETHIRVASLPKTIAVRALDAAGNDLGTSLPVST
jgi:hypothetical protein